MDARCGRPSENAAAVAVEWVRGLAADEPVPGEPRPFGFRAGYDPVQLSLGMDARMAAILARQRSGRCFYAPTPRRALRQGREAACARAGVRARRSVRVAAADASSTAGDERYGRVRAWAWAGLHPKRQSHPARGTRRTRPVARGDSVFVEASGLPRRTHDLKALWLWQSGPGEPDLDLVLRSSVRRSNLERTFRSLEQTLNWTAPRVRHPEHAGLRTWFVAATYAQFRLTRGAVADRRLSREWRLEADRLTPCGVRRAVSALPPALGTLASPP